MANKSINQDIFNLRPTSIIELIEIDTREITQSSLAANVPNEEDRILKFHTSYEQTNYNPIYFGGKKYVASGITFNQNSARADGRNLPRPILRIGNTDGIVSYYLKLLGTFIGLKITRKKTFAKYLDGNTWGSGAVNPYTGTTLGNENARLVDDIFFVEKINAENKHVVEFQLATALEFKNAKIPSRRMLATHCSFDYRNSSGCGYSGNDMYDASNSFIGSGANSATKWSVTSSYSAGETVYIETPSEAEQGSPVGGSSRPNNPNNRKRIYYYCHNDSPVGLYPPSDIKQTYWKVDQCSKTIQGCMLRFGPSVLPFGGFPALRRVEYA